MEMKRLPHQDTVDEDDLISGDDKILEKAKKRENFLLYATAMATTVTKNKQFVFWSCAMASSGVHGLREGDDHEEEQHEYLMTGIAIFIAVMSLIVERTHHWHACEK